MIRIVRSVGLAHLAMGATVLFAALLFTACGQSPPSWDNLLSGKVSGQYPSYTVTVPVAGQLRVERPGMPTKTIEVNPIAQHCLRGPKDCNYAVEQMLVELRDP